MSCSSADARSSTAADGSAYTPFPFIDLLPPLFPSWLTPALSRFPSYPLLAAGEIIVKWSSISSCLNCCAVSLVFDLDAISMISFDPLDDGPFPVSSRFGLAVLVDVKLVEFPSFDSSF